MHFFKLKSKYYIFLQRNTIQLAKKHANQMTSQMMHDFMTLLYGLWLSAMVPWIWYMETRTRLSHRLVVMISWCSIFYEFMTFTPLIRKRILDDCLTKSKQEMSENNICSHFTDKRFCFWHAPNLTRLEFGIKRWRIDIITFKMEICHKLIKINLL